MNYRFANIEDIEGVLKLQSKYHVGSIAEEDKKDGFVTTLFSPDQLTRLIEDENGLAIATDGNRIAAYAMAASWEYWSAWEFFRFMIQGLGSYEYKGEILTTKNSYQYGPVCVDKDYRGTGVLEGVFECSRMEMLIRYPILVTFINMANPRSLASHTRKIGLEIIGKFDFNGNHYAELAYDVSIPVRKKP